MELIAGCASTVLCEGKMRDNVEPGEAHARMPCGPTHLHARPPIRLGQGRFASSFR
ncbi:protein of unknown function [Rhodovastum atsumiense]|nr:protein of unknown function [Rhodovastum atsumiense]